MVFCRFKSTYPPPIIIADIMRIWGTGNPGIRHRQAAAPPAVISTLGCARNWLVKSSLKLFSDADRVTTIPVATEIRSAGLQRSVLCRGRRPRRPAWRYALSGDCRAACPQAAAAGLRDCVSNEGSWGTFNRTSGVALPPADHQLWSASGAPRPTSMPKRGSGDIPENSEKEPTHGPFTASPCRDRHR